MYQKMFISGGVFLVNNLVFHKHFHPLSSFLFFAALSSVHYIYIYIQSFCRHFYLKRLTIGEHTTSCWSQQLPVFENKKHIKEQN